MSKIIFHSKTLNEKIDTFCKSYENLPNKERPIIIITLEDFAKSAHVKISSPISIISSIISAMSLLNKDITVTIPWDKSIYNAFMSYDINDDNDNNIYHEIWVSDKTEIPKGIDIDDNSIHIINNDIELNFDMFKDKIIYLDCLYIMCNETLKSLYSHPDQLREIVIDHQKIIESFGLNEYLKHNSKINLITPQILSTTWSEFMSIIVHFLESDDNNHTKCVCIETPEDSDTFIQIMENMFKPYRNVHTILSCISCIKSVRLD